MATLRFDRNKSSDLFVYAVKEYARSGEYTIDWNLFHAARWRFVHDVESVIEFSAARVENEIDDGEVFVAVILMVTAPVRTVDDWFYREDVERTTVFFDNMIRMLEIHVKTSPDTVAEVVDYAINGILVLNRPELNEYYAELVEFKRKHNLYDDIDSRFTL